MAFIVPTLQPNLHGRAHFGACKIPVEIADPGGAPGSGIVYLRGFVSADPMFNPGPIPPTGLVRIFTLPAGMRPGSDRWFTIQTTSYLGMAAGKPSLCLIRASGSVEAKDGLGVDGGIFFDGVSFVAEQ